MEREILVVGGAKFQNPFGARFLIQQKKLWNKIMLIVWMKMLGVKSFWRTYRSKNFIWNIYYNYFIIINLQFNIFYNINFPIINFWFFIITFYKTPLLFKATTVLISSPFNLIKTKKFATKKYFFCLGRIIIESQKNII